MSSSLNNVNEGSPNFSKEEENIGAFWEKIKAFETSLKQSEGKKPYSFYDGPPFATGLPHYGHILAGTMKDVVTRYAHQTGHYVERRFGWDCVCEGTLISLADGSFKRIEDIKIGDSIKSCNIFEKKTELENQTVTNFMDKGIKECLELTLLDGTKVTCTDNHQVLTYDVMSKYYTWKEAKDINLTELIVKGDFPLSVDSSTSIRGKEILNLQMLKEFGSKINGFPSKLPIIDTDIARCSSLSRLFGAILSDGWLTNNKNSIEGGLCVTHLKDVEEVRNDIKTLGFDYLHHIEVTSEIQKTKSIMETISINLPSPLPYVMKSLGSLVGKKTTQEEKFPEWILDAPNYIIANFLSGLLGGDGHAPYITNQKVNSIRFSRTKLFNLKDSHINFMKKISYLFTKLGFQEPWTQLRVYVNTKNEQNQKLKIFENEGEAGNDQFAMISLIDEIEIRNKFNIDKHDNLMLEIVIGLSPNDLVKFENEITFSYCHHKKTKFREVMSFYKAKTHLIEVKQQYYSKIIDLCDFDGKSQKDSYEEIKEKYFNHPYYWHCMPSGHSSVFKSRGKDLKYCNNFPFSWKNSKTLQNNNQIWNYFINCNSSDFITVPLASKINVGKKHVFDISVNKNHNFLANSVVVHNCHGLPIEFEIEKILKEQGAIKDMTKEEILKFGIGNYNEECRSIVMRYASEWRKTVTRMGRWIDFDNDYKTMNLEYMESVWWVFKQLFDKDLVYRGFKVMPYSCACTTPLSNFEANSNYKDVSDPAITVTFPLVEDKNVKFIAWTTTPWTLPSNLALCVHPDKDYVKIEDLPTGNVYIMMKARLVQLYTKKQQQNYKILETFKGSTLKDKQYVPLFNYFEERSDKAFKVILGDFVTEDAGTGIVHCAPGFGEEDYKACLSNGIIEKEDVPCPIDENGRFTKKITEWAGLFVKDADKSIIKKLKDDGRLVNQGSIIHSYPFCWRSDTPLLYRTIPSWFVRVENIKESLLKNNKDTYWVPDFVKEKRFHNWLQDARDWAVSRNRYWGTPLPIWVSDDYEEVVCIGSIAELEELTGTKIKDLHRHHIDSLTIPSKKGKGELHRIEEVFDCIAEGTPVSLWNGTSCFIESLSSSNNKLLGYDDETAGLVEATQTAFRAVGERDCVELTLADGRKLVCTPDHRVLTTNGYKTAESLKLHSDELVMGLEMPLVDDIKPSEWKILAGNLEFTVNDSTNIKMSMAFARMLGYILADGSFQNHTTSNQKTCCAFFGHQLDAEQFVNDISLFVDTPPSINFNGTIYIVYLPKLLMDSMLSLEGVTVGRRIDKPKQLPTFLFAGDCPKYIIREFLAGMFGGDGCSPSLTFQKPNGKNSYVSKLSSVKLVASATDSHVESLKTYLNSVNKLLSEFDISPTLSSSTETSSSKTAKLESVERKYQMFVLIGNKQLLTFGMNIGFRYCCHKSIRLCGAMAYRRMQDNVVRQNQYLLQKVDEITNYHQVYKDGIANGLTGGKLGSYVRNHLRQSFDIAYQIALKQIEAEGLIDHNFVLSPTSVQYHLKKENNHDHMNQCCPPDEFLQKINALQFFIGDKQYNLKKEKDVEPPVKIRKVTYGANRDNSHLPTFSMKLINCKPIGKVKVYDITVAKIENFIANGIIVHNCWFESGSMPYAQCHYPFENKEKFEATFPADFIAEGLDQTRGWFYTLLVLGSAIFDKAPWKNLIVNGLVLASDAKKMSKRLKNYPDPTEVVDKYGADALRLYLINSPVVRAEPLKFKEEGVFEVVKRVFLPWYNAYRFFIQNAQVFEQENGKLFSSDEAEQTKLTNFMDKWIVSSSQSLVKFVRQEMEGYRLYTVIPKLVTFIDQLTKWYVRMNRPRLKGNQGKDDQYQALVTLYSVLMISIRTMAPFTPFLTELMYQNLKNLIPKEKREDSIHYLMIPEYDESKVHTDIERTVQRMQEVVETGRALRNDKVHGKELKMPVQEFVVLDLNEEYLNDLKGVESYIKEELNCKELILTSKFESFVSINATSNHKELGARLKKKAGAVGKKIKELTHDEIVSMLKDKKPVKIEDEDITLADLVIEKKFVGDDKKYIALSAGDVMVVMNHVVDEKLWAEGIVRVLTAQVQKLRKSAKLFVSDKADVFYAFQKDSKLEAALKLHQTLVESLLKGMNVGFSAPPTGAEIIQSVEHEESGEKFTIYLTK